MDSGRAHDAPVTEPDTVERKGATVAPDNTRVKKLEGAYFGYGDHADVYKGELDGVLVVAIKQLRGVNANKAEIRQQLLSGLHKQFSEKWRGMKHPNVCRVHMIAEGFGFLPALVIDYFPKGALIKYIEKHDPPVEQRFRWASDIANGLAYMHSNGVYHGDLRCANIFLDNADNAVIADYGIAHYFNNTDFTSAKSTGTVRWTGPEIIALPPNPKPQLDKLDVFALGMTIVEVFSGQPPYGPMSDTGAIFAIAKGEPPGLPESMSSRPELVDLFQRCTLTEPRERTTAQEAADTLEKLRPAPFPQQTGTLRRWLKILMYPALVLMVLPRFLRYMGSWFKL